MSSLVRRIQLKILRQQNKILPRHKAIRKMKGQPYRNGYFETDKETGEETFVRYH